MAIDETKVERDALTGLYSRNTFYYLVKEKIQKEPDAKYNLIISDIENFKMINLRYGEAKGDELLAYVGQCLAMTAMDSVIYARYSGDQFVGFSKQIDTVEGEHNDGVAAGMTAMYQNAPVPHFEVKFGVYQDVDLSLPVSGMCDRALMALRTIKHQYGKMQAYYDQRMHQQYMKEQHIQECMEEALKEKQFHVYYQPKHDAKTGELVGAEALARWIHPIYGFMSPGEFIPIFENNGFIAHLDRFVLNQVCQDLKEWEAESLPIVPISINASRRDMLSPIFLSSVEGAVRENGISTENLHMEITETVFIEDMEYLTPIIQTVRNWGIKIELDDFGSGYSSLSLLTSLPLDVIKLDMSFVRNIEKQRMIIENIVNICHGLKCEMVAEGVEVVEQLEALREMGCDFIQGYYFSKPLPADGFKAYMENCRKQ